jgi:hypothetical protein
MLASAAMPADASTGKHRVNELTFEAPRDQAPSEPIAFVCECGSARCFGTVWLTAEEYEVRHTSELAISRPGH